MVVECFVVCSFFLCCWVVGDEVVDVFEVVWFWMLYVVVGEVVVGLDVYVE